MFGTPVPGQTLLQDQTLRLLKPLGLIFLLLFCQSKTGQQQKPGGGTGPAGPVLAGPLFSDKVIKFKSLAHV